MYDILIKNGRVFDGEAFLSCDVAVSDGKIAALAPALPGEAKYEIDAAGTTVCHGLIDAHTHIFPLCDIGIDPKSAMLPFGVTGAVDAGSAGCNTWRATRAALDGCGIALKCLLNVSSAGLFPLRSEPEDIDPAHFEEAKIARILRDEPTLVKGLKIRVGRELTRDMGKAPLRAAAEMAHRLGVPLCVHVSDPAFPAGELAEFLDAGDVFTHTYQGRSNTILTENGRVDPRIKAARARGVVFDVGDARIHFDAEVFRRAAEDGFLPDTFGSDMTDGGIFRRGAFALPYVLSKFVSLGMDEAVVLRAATVGVARQFGMPDARVKVGNDADLAVFAIRRDLPPFLDAKNREIEAKYVLCPRATVKNGTVVWRSMEF